MLNLRFVNALKSPLRKLSRVVERGHRNMPVGASILGQPRLIFCVEGRAHYLRQHQGDPSALELKPGEGIFVAPGRWVVAVPRHHYVCAGIIVHPNFVRLYRISFTPGHPEPARPVVDEEQILPVAPGEDALLLCQLLESEAHPKLAAEYAGPLGQYLCRIVRALLLHPLPSRPGKAYFTWQTACYFVEEHLHQALDRQRVADHLRIHPNHLTRLCREHERMSFSHFLQAQRLQRAQLMLGDPSLNIGEIAARCGFGSASYFIRLFRQRYGQSPSESRLKDALESPAPRGKIRSISRAA